jgi:hypothetical protein
MTIKILKLLALALLPFYLAGCATGSISPTPKLSESETVAPLKKTSAPWKFIEKAEDQKTIEKAKTPQQPHYISITPFSAFTEEIDSESNGEMSFSDAYTRVIIQGRVFADKKSTLESLPTEKAPEETFLPYEPRGWLRRALVGKEFSMNLTAKVVIGSLEQTVPLVTIGHSSNSDGEKWTRSIHHSASNFPLFLVKGDGSASDPRIRFTVSAANSYASNGAAAALGVALQVAKATSSAPTVITRLTSDSTKTEAQAIDNAISKLFGSALAEEHWTDRDLKKQSVNTANAHGALVQFSIPTDESDFQSKPIPLGTWQITFDSPRPSIFVDWRVCSDTFPRCKTSLKHAKAAVVADIDSGEVLNYKLVPSNPQLATVRAYLGGLDWYSAAITSFATQKGAELDATANAFCRRVVNEVTGLGLNGFDAGAVLWAVYVGMPAVFPDFSKVESCTDLMKEFAIKLSKKDISQR